MFTTVHGNRHSTSNPMEENQAIWMGIDICLRDGSWYVCTWDPSLWLVVEFVSDVTRCQPRINNWFKDTMPDSLYVVLTSTLNIIFLQYTVCRGILTHFPQTLVCCKSMWKIFSRIGSKIALWVIIEPETFFPEIFFSSVCREKMMESAGEWPMNSSRAGVI